MNYETAKQWLIYFNVGSATQCKYTVTADTRAQAIADAKGRAGGLAIRSTSAIQVGRDASPIWNLKRA